MNRKPILKKKKNNLRVILMKNDRGKTEKKRKDIEKDEKKRGHFPGSPGRKKTTIPDDRKAPDTDEEGIGIVHRPQ
jgi:hypothetical protein